MTAAVIAILAAVMIPTFTGVVEKANKSAAMQNAKNAYTEYIAASYTADPPTDPTATDFVIYSDGYVVSTATGFGVEEYSKADKTTINAAVVDGVFYCVDQNVQTKIGKLGGKTAGDYDIVVKDGTASISIGTATYTSEATEVWSFKAASSTNNTNDLTVSYDTTKNEYNVN